MVRQTWLGIRRSTPIPPPMSSEIAAVDYDRCSHCGACVPVCPPNCITLYDATLQIEANQCTGCRRCVVVCPTAALNMQAAVPV